MAEARVLCPRARGFGGAPALCSLEQAYPSQTHLKQDCRVLVAMEHGTPVLVSHVLPPSAVWDWSWGSEQGVVRIFYMYSVIGKNQGLLSKV